MEFKAKYLKYKQKYLDLKGGRLQDILNKPDYAKIKDKCNTPSNITTNFALCNKVNDSVASSNDSYIIFLFFVSVGGVNFNELEILEKIILFHKAKSNNVFIFSHISFSTINNKINSILVTNTNFSNLFTQKITEIVNPYNINPNNYLNAPSRSNANITIYNFTHGYMRNYNENFFLESDYPHIRITKDQYFNCLVPIFRSQAVINLTLVNNNCYSTYTTHGYFKEKLSNLTGRKSNLSNLFTYSLRPYIKYLFYLRFILCFFDSNFIRNFGLLISYNDKISLFLTIKSLIITRLADPIFANSVKNIFYESIDNFIISLNRFFDFFIHINNFNNINDLILQLNNPNYMNRYANIPKETININIIDLSDDDNITNTLNRYLEQSSLEATKSYLIQEIKSSSDDDKYTKLLDVNMTIRNINNDIRIDVDYNNKFMTKDDSNFFGLIFLREIIPNDFLERLIKISFDEQKDILFVPVEPDDAKREKMRNMRLIDLL
jgi:hypothetical protein